MKSKQEEIYSQVLGAARTLPPFNERWRRPENLVPGCQATMYLHCEIIEDKFHFYADSDALISKGLAALLIDFYNGKRAEEILKISPTFIEELNLPKLLSPNRANGLASLHLAMKKQALAYLVAH